MAFIPKLDTESFGDLFSASKHVLRDSWRDGKAQFAVLALIAVGIAIVPYATSGIQALLLNELSTAYHSHVARLFLWQLLGATAVVFFCREGLFAFMQHYQLRTRTARQQNYDLRFYEKLAQLDVATHENGKFRDQLQVVQEHGSSFAVAGFFNSLVGIVSSLISVITAASIVLFTDWRLFLLILVSSAPRFYIEARYGESLWNIYQSQSEDRRLYVEVTRHMETKEGVRELHLFQTIPYFVGRQRYLLEKFLGEQQKKERARFRAALIAEWMLVIAIGISLYVLVERVVGGLLQIGTFTFIFAAIVGFQDAVAGFFGAVASQISESRTVASFFDILSRERAVPLPKQGVRLTCSKAPRIEFKDVTFAYPRNPDVVVLKNFSLTIESGERIAIVGVNGAGKSTMMKLLCRIYDPTSGCILIDGIDLRDIDLDSWYNCLGILLQEYETYRFPVDDSIALGRLGDRSEQGIVNAAKRAQADPFIMQWPDGYRHQIGSEFSNGTDPSGGQLQLLALARTLYRDASVTILDEPTAHVDAEAERIIFEQLDMTSAFQTLIFISHRFSTVRRANRVCVIENGSVSELGSHEELLAHDGTYAHLFRLQAEGYR